MNKREAAIISAYTGITIGNFSDTHKYIEEIIGRPVFIHELANADLWKKIKEKAWPDFVKIHESITEE